MEHLGSKTQSQQILCTRSIAFILTNNQNNGFRQEALFFLSLQPTRPKVNQKAAKRTDGYPNEAKNVIGVGSRNNQKVDATVFGCIFTLS